MVMNAVGLVGWVGGWLALLGVSTYQPDWVALVFMPYFLYGFYRATVQLRYFPTAFRMRRILRTYPWQILTDVPRGVGSHPGAQDDGPWVELPNPADGAGPVPLVFISHLRSHWWLRHIGGPRTAPELKARLEPLWFAGDPRFLGVVAVSRRAGNAPRRLHFLYQPQALGKASPKQGWSAGSAELERARMAGARISDTASGMRR
ncbi:hypothetical protein ABZ383_00975 [Streptomyces sp. NPDC005900]|uniref:hypothetical protein n=1 Tax=Streptomyces sp. NPDC005900 TaxID=3154569 RepID=UPI0033FD7ED2